MINLILSIAGTVLALYSGAVYIHSIVRGPTRPHRVTWGGWTLAGWLGLWASWAGGAEIGLLVSAAFVGTVTTVFVLSLNPKYGKPGGSKYDYVAGLVAGLALVAWQVFNFSPGVAATIAVAADIVFLWPTLREAWHHPELEALKPWVLGAVAESLGVITLGNYSYASAAYPVYILLGNLAIVGALIVRQPKRKIASI